MECLYREGSPCLDAEIAVATSFRDPGGRLSVDENGVFRHVFATGLQNWRVFKMSATVRRLGLAGQIVDTRVVSELDRLTILEHQRAPFASFPHEWPPQMLYAAAELTLDLGEGLVTEGLGLKDATPHNVLFHGPRAVFVDVLSAETRTPGDGIWLAGAQFVRTFLLPLIMNRELAIPLGQMFLTRRDGIEAEEVARALPWWKRALPPLLGLVTLPGLLKRFSGGQKLPVMTDEMARYILAAHFRRLRKLLRRFRPRPTQSGWTQYATGCPSYTEAQREAKQAFVRQVLHVMSPKNVLDVGANDGEYSLLAAVSGASVVAIDSDPAVCGRLYEAARQRHADILPLVVDFARPSPAVGWRCAEQSGFLDRATKAFDCVLMLAVLHHLLVTDQIPLDQILVVASTMTRQWLVLEYVDPADPMFRKLARGRDALYGWLTRAAFLSHVAVHFDVVDSCEIPNSGRCVYLLRLCRTAV